jgi:hypothetical protein
MPSQIVLVRKYFAANLTLVGLLMYFQMFLKADLTYKFLVTYAAEALSTPLFMVSSILSPHKWFFTLPALVLHDATVNIFPHPLTFLFPVLQKCSKNRL